MFSQAWWYDCAAVGLFHQVGGFLPSDTHRQATTTANPRGAPIDKPAPAATRLSNCTHPSTWGSSRRFCPTSRRVDACDLRPVNQPAAEAVCPLTLSQTLLHAKVPKLLWLSETGERRLRCCITQAPATAGSRVRLLSVGRGTFEACFSFLASAPSRTCQFKNRSSIDRATHTPCLDTLLNTLTGGLDD